jgi:hypothetical protein
VLSGSTETIYGGGGSFGFIANPQTLNMDNKIDQMASEADRNGDYRDGCFGTSKVVDDGDGLGNTVIFQYEVMAFAALAYNNNVLADSRIGPGIAATAAYVRDNWTGPHAADASETHYVQSSYPDRDPADVDSGDDATWVGADNGWIDYPHMNMHLAAYKYAYDGDTDHRDVWDHITTQPNPIMDPPGGAGGSTKNRKLFGQIFCMAIHGAAWRAGAPATGY